MSGRIVVGVDGSQGARAALEWALAEARLRGDTVEVVHAWHAPPHMILGRTPARPLPARRRPIRMREQAEHLLEHEARAAGHPRRRDRIDRDDGLRGELALDVAKGADLLVVGTRGRGGFTGLLLGSVSRRPRTTRPAWSSSLPHP